MEHQEGSLVWRSGSRLLTVALSLLVPATACKTRASQNASPVDSNTVRYYTKHTMHIAIGWGHSADPVAAYFGNGTLLAGERAAPMQLKQWFRGVTTEGRTVQVMIDNWHHEEREFGAPTFHMRVRTRLDSAEKVLFWDTPDTITILLSRPITLDSASAYLLQQRALALHRAALTDADVVPAHGRGDRVLRNEA